MARNKKQQIIDLACEKFYKNGFSKISMDSLVDELRISKSTLYKYFPSKEELVMATVQNHTDNVDQYFEKLLANKDLTVIEIFRKFTLFYSSVISKLSEEYLRELELYFQVYWGDKTEERVIRFSRYFGKIYDLGVEQGIFRKDINRDIAVFIYTKSTEIQFRKYRDYLNASREEIILTASDIFIRGVLTAEGMQLLGKHQY